MRVGLRMETMRWSGRDSSIPNGICVVDLLKPTRVGRCAKSPASTGSCHFWSTWGFSPQIENYPVPWIPEHPRMWRPYSMYSPSSPTACSDRVPVEPNGSKPGTSRLDTPPLCRAAPLNSLPDQSKRPELGRPAYRHRHAWRIGWKQDPSEQYWNTNAPNGVASTAHLINIQGPGRAVRLLPGNWAVLGVPNPLQKVTRIGHQTTSSSNHLGTSPFLIWSEEIGETVAWDDEAGTATSSSRRPWRCRDRPPLDRVAPRASASSETQGLPDTWRLLGQRRCALQPAHARWCRHPPSRPGTQVCHLLATEIIGPNSPQARSRVATLRCVVADQSISTTNRHRLWCRGSSLAHTDHW